MGISTTELGKQKTEKGKYTGEGQLRKWILPTFSFSQVPNLK